MEFSCKKLLLQGISEGFKGIVTQPVTGAQKSGLRGFVKGTGFSSAGSYSVLPYLSVKWLKSSHVAYISTFVLYFSAVLCF